jgi:hypothetical protein
MLSDSEASVANHIFIAMYLYIAIRFKLLQHDKFRHRFFALATDKKDKVNAPSLPMPQ